MIWFRELWRRIIVLVRGSRFDQDLAEEMRLHLDLRTADRITDGMRPDEAEAAARRQFGNTTRLQEISRETWHWPSLDALRQDVRYGWRALLKQPAFTITAIVSLALGIGANTAIFSIIDALLLRTLPVEDPQALVQLRLGTGGDDELNTPLWEQIRDHQRAFSGALAYSPDRFNLADSGESRYARGLWVSGDFYRVLGVPAMLGRTFTAADDEWGGGRDGAVAVVSHAFWQSYLGGDPGVIGRTVRLNRQNFVVVGVTPPWFTGLDVDRPYDIAVPIGCQPVMRPGMQRTAEVHHWWLRVVARLGPGGNLGVAEERMRAIAPQIFRAALGPDRSDNDYRDAKFVLQPAGLGFSQARVKYRTALYVLMAIVAVVLLIACANIANLLLARGAARQRELSVRMAIGASRRRVVRQLMTENLLLAVFGAAGGLLLARWGSKALLGFISTPQSAVAFDIGADPRVLAFTTAVTVLTTLLFGLVPSLRSTRIGLNTALKKNERGTIAGGSRFNAAKLLVAGQVALSMMLLVGAGLFVSTLHNLLTVDVGFDRRNILLMHVDLRENTTTQQRTQSFRDILARVQTIPGVTSAAHSVLTPIRPEGWAQPVFPEGFVAKSKRDNVVFLNRVSAGYFRTMRTPLIMGREFTERDTLTAPRVIVISESTARAFFGTANPIGRTIGMDKPGRRGERDSYEVVGVVKDTKYNRVDEQTRRIAYLAGEQDPEPGPGLRYAILSETSADALIPSIHAAVSAVNRDASLEFRTLETQVNESLLQPRLVATLSSIFGGLALLLAVIGLYGITAYSVTRRKSEIGVRIAMGAQRASVMWLVMRDVAILLAAGTVVGCAASIAVSRLAGTLLYGIQPNAPGPLATAAAILMFAAAAAAYVPARRAARLDPVVALRDE